MFPFAELVVDFTDDDQDSMNSGDDENPDEMLTYFSLSYSDCYDNNPLAADIRTRFFKYFRSFIDEFEDESKDELVGIGISFRWSDHVCSASRKVPSNLTDSLTRCLFASVYESSRPRKFKTQKYNQV